MMHRTPDEQFNALLAGDQHAWIEFVDEHHDALVGRAIRSGVPQTDAEDLVQETWFYLLRTVATKVASGSVTYLCRAFLLHLLRYKVLDYWKRTRRRRPMVSLDSFTDDHGDALLELLFCRQAEIVKEDELLECLSEDQRQAVRLAFLDGYTLNDVAQQMCRSLHAVRTLLDGARCRMRRMFDEGTGQ